MAAVPEDDTQPYDAHIMFHEVAAEPSPPKVHVFESAEGLRANYQNVPLADVVPATQVEEPKIEEPAAQDGDNNKKPGGKSKSKDDFEVEIETSGEVRDQFVFMSDMPVHEFMTFVSQIWTLLCWQVITRREQLAMKGPSRGRGRGGGKGRGRGRGANTDDAEEKVEEQEIEEENEGGEDPPDGPEEVAEVAEVLEAKPTKAAKGKDAVKDLAEPLKRKRGKQPQSPKPKAEATSKRRKKVANTAGAPIYEANEKKIKTMTNFCGKFDLDFELDDFRALIKCEFPEQWEFAKLTTYWTRAQCTVRKWEKGWHDCAFFSFESHEKGPHNLKLILVVAAGMRLVPYLSCLGRW